MTSFFVVRLIVERTIKLDCNTYFLFNRFDESSSALRKALDLLPDDNYVQLNHLAALMQMGRIDMDETVIDIFDLSNLSAEERLKVMKLKGAVNYKKGNFRAAIEAFGALDWNDLDEASAIDYSLALQESGCDEKALDVLSFAANKIGSSNLYHYLATAYLHGAYVEEALAVYENFLCHLNEPSDLVRQLLVEYAQLLKYIDRAGNCNKFRRVCEKAIDFKLFPPPQSKADCFFTGFAYYILGRSELAKHYHEYSADFSAEYYDKIEL